MKRELLIATAVLVPFAGLVAFGFSLLGDPAPVVLSALEPPEPGPRAAPGPAPAQPTPAPGPVAVAPVRKGPPPLRTDVAVVAPTQPLPPPPPAPPPAEDARKVPILAAVEPLVQQCFRDASDRLRAPLQVTVSFNPTSEGGFGEVVIKRASWQEPQLTACVLDAFEDARYEPSGVVARRRTHTFTFAPPDAGR